MKKNVLLVIFFFVIIFGCHKNSTSPEEESSYTPQNVGDVRQIVFHEDSTTILWTIKSKIDRSDGTNVFHEEWVEGIQDLQDFYKYVNSEKYYVATLLDSVADDPILRQINPFQEQRLAKAFPNDGEYFIQIKGDTTSAFWYVKYYGKFTAFCGEFDDTYSFELHNQADSSLILITYYSKGVGYIGTVLGDGITVCSCSYIKVGNNTMGKLFPAKDAQVGINKSTKLFNKFSIIGNYVE